MAPVTSGIPQGSVLGPILFVIYIDDMPEIVDEKSEIFLFADDTKVFRRIESDADILQLQNDIDNLVKWSETWLLRCHPDKCVSMTISNRRSDPPVNKYFMGGIAKKALEFTSIIKSPVTHSSTTWYLKPTEY